MCVAPYRGVPPDPLKSVYTIKCLRNAPGYSIAYGCIQGAVRPVDKALQSQYNHLKEAFVHTHSWPKYSVNP